MPSLEIPQGRPKASFIEVRTTTNPNPVVNTGRPLTPSPSSLFPGAGNGTRRSATRCAANVCLHHPVVVIVIASAATATTVKARGLLDG